MMRRTRRLLAVILLLPLGGCRTPGLQPGSVLPELQVDGWINGTSPSNEMLRGKVIVLDIFASW